MLLMKDTTSFALSLWLRRATYSDSGEGFIGATANCAGTASASGMKINEYHRQCDFSGAFAKMFHVIASGTEVTA
jgi:hypothetical protein